MLYGQNDRVILKDAVWLAIIVYSFAFVVVLFMLAPAVLHVYLIPGAGAASGAAFEQLFAWSVKAALLAHTEIARLMQVYFKTVQGKKLTLKWEAKLENSSANFRALKNCTRLFCPRQSLTYLSVPISG